MRLKTTPIGASVFSSSVAPIFCCQELCRKVLLSLLAWMQFGGFTKTDLVTLVNDEGNWKVSQSVNSYK
ncbi:hypothetical protein [Sphingobacterium sp. IITKGP-BTPF85]|uniref:hypothetical protein n=1 Tax=Sphingobacterium sp. IITKGP-BTPF85 TaxID=1338009 RepID=UPI000389EA11|nr:hypothetical protein [Sphingobacterium sp. IITKGP-BTPF85]KKX46569.1 hypothetical protein L950_0231235 [Sphingobacterium sp. IITKGP-BTPF85]